MPYKNIVFIKLFLDLFDGDDRFLYDLTERQQLLYIKLLYLSGRTDNKIPKNSQYLVSKTAYASSNQDLTLDISRIKEVFKKFTETKHYYIFTNFDKLHNRVNDNKIGSSQVSPKYVPLVHTKEKEKEKENKKEKGDLFNTIWKEYPNKDGKKEALKHFNASVKTDSNWDDILKALENYKKHLSVETWKRPKNGSTWFNNWQDWIDFDGKIVSKPKFNPEIHG